MTFADKMLLDEIDRLLADPNFNTPRPKGLKWDESKATAVSMPDGSAALLWGHAKWRQALNFARKRGIADGAGMTFTDVIIVSHTRELVRVAGPARRLAFVDGRGFELVEA